MIQCEIKDGEKNNLVRPADFENMDPNGLIYIDTHGVLDRERGWGIEACPIYHVTDDLSGKLVIEPALKRWMDETDIRYWGKVDAEIYPTEDIFVKKHYEAIMLKEPFFDDFIDTQDFSGSLVYLNCCLSWNFHEDYNIFSNAKVFIGNVGSTEVLKTQGWADSFFKYMISPFGSPVSARNAYNSTLEEYPHQIWNVLGDPMLNIDTGDANENDSTYLPDDVDVIIHKK